MACRFRFKETCLDGRLYSLDNIGVFHRLVLCYPPRYCNDDVLHERLESLRRAGVDYIVDYGGYGLYGYHVLGKGYSSIVTLCIQDNEVRVLKIRRLDSRRRGLEFEAVILEYLEPYELSPKIYSWSKDYIVMEYVDGIPLPIYIENMIGEIDHLRRVLRKLLVKAFLLDGLGVDHGELNRPGSHVMVVGDDIVFLDFESASVSRRPRNLTSLASYLFLRSRFRRKLMCSDIGDEEIIYRLRMYKERLNSRSLRRVLEIIQCEI